MLLSKQREDSPKPERKRKIFIKLYNKSCLMVFNYTPIRYNREKYRKYKICPTCKKSVKKLSNHYIEQHKNVSSADRLKHLKTAKLAPPKYIQQVTQQTKLSFKPKSRPREEDLTASSATIETCSTRDFEKFPHEHAELVQFKIHLTSLDGKRKSDDVAKAIVTDVSKYLKFCNPEMLEWKYLEHSSKILE